MDAGTPVVVGPATVTIGAPSLVQGVYGSRGNLELVACDAADGLWVFWFNADVATNPSPTPDVPPGSWSPGLRFAGGGRYLDAQILQSTLGPDHLEVLALDAAGVLQSWYWSPGPGFQRRTTDAATDVAAFSVDQGDGVVTVTVESADGTVRHVVADGSSYPDRRWHDAAAGPALVSDEDALAWLLGAGVSRSAIADGTARRSASTRDGGTAELVWRDAAGAIRHLGLPLR